MRTLPIVAACAAVSTLAQVPQLPAGVKEVELRVLSSIHAPMQRLAARGIIFLLRQLRRKT